MDRYKFIALLSLVLFCANGALADLVQPASNEEALRILDQYLEQIEIFQKKRQSSIDSLKKCMPSATSEQSKLELLDQIAAKYEYFQLDSAVTYRTAASNLAFGMGDMDEGYVQIARKCANLSLLGATSRAVNLYESIDPAKISLSRRMDFHESGARLFTTFGFYHPVDTIRRDFLSKSIIHVDSIISMSDDSIAFHQYYLAQKYFSEGQTSLVVGSLTSVLDDVDFGNKLFANAARMLGVYFRSKGKDEQAIYYLTISSISEIKNGSRDSRALMSLAELLYAVGDVGRAFTCLRAALDNSVVSGANLHSMEAARQVPMVVAAFRDQDKRKMDILLTLAIVLFVLLAVIVGVMIYLRREMRSMRRMRQNIIEANKMKKTYISHFINLSSIYLEKLDEFSRLARRKITAGQVDDLYELIRSGKMMDEQSRIFYEKFDTAFTLIFPDFVDGVNALLLPDKQVTVPENGRLTTELRILAFARLGIDDAAQIARFLGLSQNTIYTYRNKMRSKARNRATFEEDLLSIGSIA